MLINFAEETRQTLAEFGYTVDDIAWVGDTDGHYRIPIDRFWELAEATTYDNDVFFCYQIPADLGIFMTDGGIFMREKYEDVHEKWIWTNDNNLPREVLMIHAVNFLTPTTEPLDDPYPLLHNFF